MIDYNIMNKTLLNIIAIIWIIEVFLLEALYKTNHLAITNLVLYISLFCAIILSYTIIKSSYIKSVINKIIIIFTAIGYLLLILDMFVMNWQDNAQIFIDLNKIVFISLITVQIKINRKKDMRIN